MLAHKSSPFDELQKEVDAKLEEVLTDTQRDQLADMQESGRRTFGRGGPPGFGPQGFRPPGFGPPGFGPGGSPDFARDRRQGGPPQDRDGGPGRDRDRRDRDRGRGGPRGSGPGGLFRSYRYAAAYPAFDGKTLTPGEELATQVAATEGPGRSDRADRDERPDRPE